MKFVFLTLLIIGFPCLIFGFGPIYYDEFYIENRTDDDIVIVFEAIGLRGPLLYYNIDNERTVSFRFLGLTDSQKRFRTIEPGEIKFTGYSEYNYEEFNNFSPSQKFSAFFDFILIFNSNGDLLYRIDNFNNAIIVDHTTGRSGVYMLVIE